MADRQPVSPDPPNSRWPAVLPWLFALRYDFAWFVPAFLSVLVKIYVMANGKGFRVVARSLGRIEGTGYTGLNFWERLTFFRSEIFVNFLVIPVALLILYRFLSRPWRIVTAAFVSVGATLALFVQFRALEEVGRYTSLHMLGVALSWGWHDPGANKAYLLTPAFFALLASLALIAGSLWWAAKGDTGSDIFFVVSRRPSQWFLLAGAGILAVLSWLPLLPATPFHANVLWRVLGAFWHEGEVDTREFIGLSLPQLAGRYRELARAPAWQPDPRFFGKEKGANILFFLLETTPARFLPADDPLDEFPSLRRLEPHSFIATQHYTTYPYTNRAIFSLFSACYPSDGIETFGEQHPGMTFPGMMRALAAEGYRTAVFSPSPWHGGPDEATYQSLGFEEQVFPDSSSLAASMPSDLTPAWKAERVGRDLAALALLKADMNRWLDEGRHFAAVFVPQIGHAPWPDRVNGEDENNYLKRGRAVLSRQDAWLAEILNLLEHRHQLENTIIVVTGDHGIRTRREDPSFAGGTIDDYTFHVPLRIYAPRAVESAARIPWVTSHIDVAPTVLDLLGVASGREFEEGSAIWNPALAERTTFFFAMQAVGADGFHAGDRFFMWNQMTDSVFASAQPHFDTQNLLPRDSGAAQAAVRSISRIIGLEQIWVAQLAREMLQSQPSSTGSTP